MDLRKWLTLQWDRVAGWAAVLAGAVALIVGWFGVSGTAYQSEQIPYIVSGGIGGLFLLGLGGLLWLSADMRDEWYKLDRVEEELRLTRAAGLGLPSNDRPAHQPAPLDQPAEPELDLIAVRARKTARA